MEVSFDSWQEPLLALSHNSSINIQSHLSLCSSAREGQTVHLPFSPHHLHHNYSPGDSQQGYRGQQTGRSPDRNVSLSLKGESH